MATANPVLWNKWLVRWDFTTRVRGGLPASLAGFRVMLQKKVRNIIQGKYLTSYNTYIDRYLQQITRGPTGRTPANPLQEAINYYRTTFRWDDTGPYILGGMVRAHLKENATLVGWATNRHQQRVPGLGSFQGLVKKYLWVEEDYIYFRRGETILNEPDGTEALQIRHRSGDSYIRISDYFDPPVFVVFTLLVTKNIHIGNDDDLRLLLDAGSVRGFGQDRALQFGRYKYTLTKLEN